MGVYVVSFVELLVTYEQWILSEKIVPRHPRSRHHISVSSPPAVTEPKFGWAGSLLEACFKLWVVYLEDRGASLQYLPPMLLDSSGENLSLE